MRPRERIPHRYEGLIAARIQRVPVRCSVIEVAVELTETTLAALVRNAAACFGWLRTPGVDWASIPESVEVIEERRDGDVLHRSPYGFPEVR